MPPQDLAKMPALLLRASSGMSGSWVRCLTLAALIGRPLSSVHASAAVSSTGDATCAKDAKNRDSVLLQMKQSLERTQAETAVQCEPNETVPEASAWLGWSHNLASGDYWSMQNIGAEYLYTADMPSSCFEEAHCSHKDDFTIKHFNSVHTWSNYYSTSFNLGLSLGYAGISGSIDGSLGNSGGMDAKVLKNLSYAKKSVQRKCYRLIRDEGCAYNRSYIKPAVFERLKSAVLPTGGPHTAEKMQAWKDSFIDRFGTHITMGSSHGALLQSLLTMDYHAEASQECMDSGMCLSFPWINVVTTGVSGGVKAELCRKSSACDSSNEWSETSTSTCSALGGDPELRQRICRPEVSQEELDRWFSGGDVLTADSVFKYSFMPLHDFIVNIDFEEFVDAAKMLEKAVEYSRCRVDEWPPVQRWEPGGRFKLLTSGSCGGEGLLPINDLPTCQTAVRALGLVGPNDKPSTTKKADRPEGCYYVRTTLIAKAWLSTNPENQGKGAEASYAEPYLPRHPICMSGDFGCQCIRQCANGGSLDVSGCTCKCRGDEKHGWTGPNCWETYGSCQPGPGTGNVDAARKCRTTNTCASSFHVDHCKPTEVCCASTFGTKCCPFGSKCSCSLSQCSCVSQ